MKRLAHALFLLPLLSVFVVTGAWADAKAGAQKAAVCAACHGADGNSPMGQYPDLAQQTARYTYMQLRDFKEGRRKDPLMSPMAANLSREDMLDLADYFAQQKHRPSGFKTDPAKVAEGKRIADAAHRRADRRARAVHYQLVLTQRCACIRWSISVRTGFIALATTNGASATTHA
jgi:cytochrome c553